MKGKVRLGVIGFGRLGSTHARNIAISNHAELFAVCDTSEEALTSAASRYKVKTFSDMAAFLAEPLDGVVVASNTPLHLEHIRVAANAGKHIFTEKPIGLTLEQTDEVLQEVVDTGVLFQIGFQRRWDPRFLRAKAAIQSGKIGAPVLYKAFGRDPNASSTANWGLSKNGGLFLNAAIHDYDAARFLMGREITSLSATGAALVYPGLAQVGDVDTCATTLFFENNAMAMLEWSRYATYGYDIGAEIIGTEGMIRIGREQASSVAIYHKKGDVQSVFDVFADAYAAEIDGFAQSIAAAKPTTPGIEDARIALNLALLARNSYEAGNKLVGASKLVPLTAG